MIWGQVYDSRTCHLLVVIRLFVTLISILLPYLMLYSKYLIGNLYIVMFEHLES